LFSVTCLTQIQFKKIYKKQSFFQERSHFPLNILAWVGFDLGFVGAAILVIGTSLRNF